MSYVNRRTHPWKRRQRYLDQQAALRKQQAAERKEYFRTHPEEADRAMHAGLVMFLGTVGSVAVLHFFDSFILFFILFVLSVVISICVAPKNLPK